MAIIWTPDICPKIPRCDIELDRNTGEPIAVERACSHHASLGLSDADLMLSIFNTCRAKERSLAVATDVLTQTQESPVVSWSLTTDGAVVIRIEADLKERQDVQDAISLILQNYPGASLIVG